MYVSDRTQVAIGVPVRNEKERLPHLLRALADQTQAPPFAVCLFFDNCDDGSIEAAASLAAELPYVVKTQSCERTAIANAGLARRKAMSLALAEAPAGMLLTTDADGEPAPDWIAANLVALAIADVVAGRIVRGSGPPSAKQDRVESYYDRLHGVRRAIDPVTWERGPAHHWTSGASLALHADTYRALGGFAPIANGEDAALCDAAARAGYRIRRETRAVVRTSARRHGRADRGFAATLAELDRGDRLPTTYHPDDEAWRYRMHAKARRLHGSGDYRQFARILGLPEAELAQVADECRNGEAFAARIVGAPPGGMRTVSLAHAELLLAALEQSQLEGAA